MKYLKKFENHNNKVYSKDELDILSMATDEQKYHYMITNHPNYKKGYKLVYFLASPIYEEVEVDGEIYHKKDYDIETFVVLDENSFNDAISINMMKIRARFQGDDTKLYQIWTDLLDDYDKSHIYGSDVDPEIRKMLVENAMVVR